MLLLKMTLIPFSTSNLRLILSSEMCNWELKDKTAFEVFILEKTNPKVILLFNKISLPGFSKVEICQVAIDLLQLSIR